MTILYGGKQVDLFHPAKSTGTQIAAINKTGAVINESDKVWLNKEEQTVDNALTVKSKTSNLNSYGTVLDLTGNMVFSFDEGISIIDNTVGTRLTLSCYCNVRYNHNAQLRYGINDSIFTREGRTDSFYNWKDANTDNDYYLGDEYMCKYISGKHTICKVDLTSGETLETYTGNLSSVTGSRLIKLHNKNEFIGIYNSIKLFTFDDTGAIVSRTLGTETISSTNVAIMGVTLDNKYLVCDNNGKLVIIDISDIENPHFLSEGEALPDLQPFMNKSGCYFAFNPFNGSLSAIYTDSSDCTYKIFKYENGEFKPLNIDFGSNIPMGPITFSKDLSRAAFVNYNSTGQTIVVDLKTESGYSCLPYKFYNISENTITGYAANTAGLNEQVKVRTVTE